jgi:hypothetical protein
MVGKVRRRFCRERPERLPSSSKKAARLTAQGTKPKNKDAPNKSNPKAYPNYLIEKT